MQNYYLEHSGEFVDEVCWHANLAQPFDHVLLLLGIGRRTQDQASCEVGLVVYHEDVLVL